MIIRYTFTRRQSCNKRTLLKFVTLHSLDTMTKIAAARQYNKTFSSEFMCCFFVTKTSATHKQALHFRWYHIYTYFDPTDAYITS